MPANPSITVRFYADTVIDNETSKAVGHAVFRSENEFCELKFAADKNKVLVFPAHEAEPNATREAGVPVSYAEVYKKQYAAFKRNAVQEQEGTPLAAGRAFLTAQKQAELKALNIHNLEALAALDGQPLKLLGPGGRDLKNQAAQYLEASRATIDTAALMEEIENLRADNARLRGTVADTEGTRLKMPNTPERRRAVAGAREEIKREDAATDKALARNAEAPEDDEEVAPSDGPTDEEIDAEAQRKADAEAAASAAAGNGADSVEMPFDEWDDESLKIYIAEKGGNGRPRGNPSHETLVAAAQELANAETN